MYLDIKILAQILVRAVVAVAPPAAGAPEVPAVVRTAGRPSTRRVRPS